MLTDAGNFYAEFHNKIHIMGILNVTPDSFSDGGKYDSTEKALEHARQMHRDGADVIDVGGESTRPGAKPVSLEEELHRVIPVIEKISSEMDTILSVDTSKSAVAEAALKAGASIVNDVSGLTSDPNVAAVAAKYDAALVVMHMKGTPQNMQIAPSYNDVVAEVMNFLEAACAKARNCGVTRLIVDPGFGFGKRAEDNFMLLKNLDRFRALGYPILVGTSRKMFLGRPFDAPPEDRLEGTIASNIIAAQKGATILRVHDVKAVRRAISIALETMGV